MNFCTRVASIGLALVSFAAFSQALTVHYSINHGLLGLQKTTIDLRFSADGVPELLHYSWRQSAAVTDIPASSTAQVFSTEWKPNEQAFILKTRKQGTLKLDFLHQTLTRYLFNAFPVARIYDRRAEVIEMNSSEAAELSQRPATLVEYVVAADEQAPLSLRTLKIVIDESATQPILINVQSQSNEDPGYSKEQMNNVRWFGFDSHRQVYVIEMNQDVGHGKPAHQLELDISNKTLSYGKLGEKLDDPYRLAQSSYLDVKPKPDRLIWVANRDAPTMIPQNLINRYAVAPMMHNLCTTVFEE